jgi:hypothetical protein
MRRSTATGREIVRLVDTDVLIDVWRGHPPAVGWFADCLELPAVPGFVVMELVQDARNSQQARQALKLVSPLQVVWPTEAECGQALANFVTYRGRPRSYPLHVQQQALPFSPRPLVRPAIRTLTPCHRS